MKVKISIVAVALILALVLAHQPPLSLSAQKTVECPPVKDTAVKIVLKPETTKLIDSLKLYTCQIDSVTTRCKKRLNLLTAQQKQLIKQVDQLDTLSTLITKE